MQREVNRTEFVKGSAEVAAEAATEANRIETRPLKTIELLLLSCSDWGSDAS